MSRTLFKIDERDRWKIGLPVKIGLVILGVIAVIGLLIWTTVIVIESFYTTAS